MIPDDSRCLISEAYSEEHNLLIFFCTLTPALSQEEREHPVPSPPGRGLG